MKCQSRLSSVRGIIADNAANVQGALAKVSEELGLAKLTLETSIFGTLQKQCLSERYIDMNIPLLEVS